MRLKAQLNSPRKLIWESFRVPDELLPKKKINHAKAGGCWVSRKLAHTIASIPHDYGLRAHVLYFTVHIRSTHSIHKNEKSAAGRWVCVRNVACTDRRTHASVVTPYQRNISHPKSIFFLFIIRCFARSTARESTILSVTKNYSFDVNEIDANEKIAVVI